MNVARMSHEMQPLPDGRLLVMGGFNGNLAAPQFYSTCQLYNPVTNTFQTAPSMSIARSNFMSVVLNNGNILAIGGYDGKVFGQVTSEIFDAGTSTWSSSASLLVPHSGGKAIKLIDGSVLVTGGNTTKTELYDPYTNKWSYVGDLNFIHGYGATLTTLANGKILIAGGDGSPNTLEIFSPISKTWAKVGNTLIHKHKHHGAVLLVDGRVLFAGSSFLNTDDQLSAEIFNPTAGTITRASNLLTNISGIQLALLDNGNVFTCGIGDIFTPGNTKPFQEYNPKTGLWYSAPSNSIGASDYTMHRLNNGDFFLAGGNFTTGNGATAGTLIIKQSGYTTCVPLNPATDITLLQTNTCYGYSNQVAILSKDPQLIYTIYNGNLPVGKVMSNGTDFPVFTIPSNNLSIGKNSITVSVKKSECVEAMLSKSVVVNVQLANTTATKVTLTSGSNLLCSDLSKAEFSAVSSTGTNRWYNETKGSTISVNESAIVFAQNVDANGCLGLPSESIVVKKITESDLSISAAPEICEVGNPVQLNGNPAGGTWSGTGVSSSGVFNPMVAGPETTTLSYSFCNYAKTLDVYVSPSNSVKFTSADIAWPATDTLCGGVGYSVKLNNVIANYRYSLYANDSLISSAIGASFAPEFKPIKQSDVTFKIKAMKAYPSPNCPKDSLIVSKIYKAMPLPSKIEVLFPDTACYGWPANLKLVRPEKNVYYYAAFYPEDFLENQGPKVFTTVAKDTMLLPSRYMGWPSGSSEMTVLATPGFRCLKASRVILKIKDVNSFAPKTTVAIGKTYYLGETIAPITTSNLNEFTWTIDGLNYNTKNAPSKVFTNTGAHTYQLIAVSKFGCSDTLVSQVQIVKKAPSISEVNCLLDTTNLKYNHRVYKTHIDYKGNTIVAGAKFNSYAGEYSGSENAFIEKYSKDGGNAIWRIEHTPNYSDDFYSINITGVTSDENNDLYVTGGYAAKILKFAGITLDHSKFANSYVHTFVAKISEAGKLVWFLYSNYEETSSPFNPGEAGGADIVYEKGLLYVSARTLGQKIWKNTSGVVVDVLNSGQGEEYLMFQVNTSGTQIKALASMNSYDLGKSFVKGLYNPNSSYYPRKIAILSPNLCISAGKIVVSGTMHGPVNFGTVLYSPDTIKGHDGNQFYYAYTEFSAVIDPAIGNWENVRLGTSTERSAFPKDKLQALAAYTPAIDKISAVNIGEYYDGGSPVVSLTQLDNGELIKYFGNASVVKKTDINGRMLWKRILKGAFIEQLYISSDQSQVIVVGNYLSGLSIGFGNEEYGMNTALNHDLFAMGFHLETGELAWTEKIGTPHYEDIYIASALTPCNDLLIFGSRPTFYFGKNSYAAGRGKDSINITKDNVYLLRIPLTGVCNSTNCKLISNVESPIQAAAEAKIFPNPTQSAFTFVTQGGEYCTAIVIKDLTGKSVKNYYPNSEDLDALDIQSLPNGMYIVEGVSNGKTYYGKLIVSK